MSLPSSCWPIAEHCRIEASDQPIQQELGCVIKYIVLSRLIIKNMIESVLFILLPILPKHFSVYILELDVFRVI